MLKARGPVGKNCKSILKGTFSICLHWKHILKLIHIDCVCIRMCIRIHITHIQKSRNLGPVIIILFVANLILIQGTPR